jgi:alkylation response protein AidB-like acyl-CoA dehydrogenase
VTDQTFGTVLEGVHRVASEAALRAEEIEELGVLPSDLFDDLVATRCFQGMLPKTSGGLGFSLAEVNELIIEGARADGSLGWILLIGIQTPLILGLFPRETITSLLSDRPQLRARGAVAPRGQAVRVDGGYVVSGQWPFASGGPNPDLVAGNCVVIDNGSPRIGPNGVPETIVVLVPANQAEFLDTWHVLGLRGSDSCDFALREVFVPEHMTTNVFTATNCFETPAARLPLRVVLALGHASVALGIAQGALDDVTELAKTKRAAMNPGALLANDPVFRHSLGEHALRHTSMRSLLDQATRTAWDAGLSARALSPKEIMMGKTMAGYITAECVKIVDAAYTAAGSTSLYDGSSLQRRLRDIHAATQHVAATSEGYRALGAVLVGEELSPMELF